MGRKTPQGRTGKLMRPLKNRITNRRFTLKEGLKLTTANLVVSNCSTEFDQTNGKFSTALGVFPLGVFVGINLVSEIPKRRMAFASYR